MKYQNIKEVIKEIFRFTSEIALFMITFPKELCPWFFLDKKDQNMTEYQKDLRRIEVFGRNSAISIISLFIIPMIIVATIFPKECWEAYTIIGITTVLTFSSAIAAIAHCDALKSLAYKRMSQRADEEWEKKWKGFEAEKFIDLFVGGQIIIDNKIREKKEKGFELLRQSISVSGPFASQITDLIDIEKEALYRITGTNRRSKNREINMATYNQEHHEAILLCDQADKICGKINKALRKSHMRLWDKAIEKGERNEKN